MNAYAQTHQTENKQGVAFSANAGARWGAARICRVTVHDLSDKPLISVPSGGSVKIAVFVETREPIKDLCATVTIRGSLTNQLLKAESQPQNTRTALRGKDLTFECTIGELPLVPGQYFISVGIAHYGVKWIQELQDVAALEISEPQQPCFAMSRHAEGPVAAKHGWIARSWPSTE